MYFFCILQFYWSSYGGCTQVVPFFKYRQCLITAPVVPAPCVCVRYANRVYAFGALTTRLRVWYIYEALTHQGEAHQYIDHVVRLNMKDSHHRLKEHTILHVFRAPGSDSLVLLS